MTGKHTEVIEEVLNKLKKQENVIGVLLFGSLANETSHAYSDIDLFVVGHNELHRTECFNQDGIQVQIIWRSPNLFKDKIMKRTRTYPISNSCKILYDKSGEISEIVELSKKQIELGPIKLTEQEKISKLSDLSIEYYTIKGIIENGNIATAIHMINELVMVGIELYYDVKGYFLLSQKHLIADLKLKSNNLGVLTENILMETDINKKMNIFHRFRKEILDISGGEIFNYELIW